MGNPCLEVVTAELESAGVPFHVEQGGKHLRIQYGQNREHLHVVSATPSDWRAPMNERSQIRRELREKGYAVSEEAPERSQIVPVQLIDGEPSCFSYDIAADFDKAHKDVLRVIDRVREECGPEFDRRNFTPVDYTDAKGRTYRAYRLTRDGFSLVVMGFTGAKATEWKVKYIAGFNAIAEQLSRLTPASQDLDRIRGDVEALAGLIGDLEARIQPAPILALPDPSKAISRREFKRTMRRFGWRAA